MNKELKQKLLENAKTMLERDLRRDGTLLCDNLDCKYCPCGRLHNPRKEGCLTSGRGLGKQWLQNWYDENKQKENNMTKDELLKERDAKIESIKSEYDEKINKLEMLDIKIALHNRIVFSYKKNEIGLISKDGALYINSESSLHEVYEEWIADGCPTNFDRRINWKGGVYGFKRINNDIIFSRFDIEKGNIFNLTNDAALSTCGDTNIIRYYHNNRPKRF